MSTDRSVLAELISSLQQRRDELALQIHLGKADAKEEWERVEEKLQKLTDEYEPVKDAVQDTASNVFSALQLAAEEVKTGLDRVSKLLSR